MTLCVLQEEVVGHLIEHALARVEAVERPSGGKRLARLRDGVARRVGVADGEEAPLLVGVKSVRAILSRDGRREGEEDEGKAHATHAERLPGRWGPPHPRDQRFRRRSAASRPTGGSHVASGGLPGGAQAARLDHLVALADEPLDGEQARD